MRRLAQLLILASAPFCFACKRPFEDEKRCKEIRKTEDQIPLVINTWPFTQAAEKAWEVLTSDGSALDAVEKGCSVCEVEQCDGTVGYGGSPDENGETTLDAMIMDGVTHDVGAVGALRNIKSAISVARMVLENTEHTLLVGDQATEFAVMMGFQEENLTTPESVAMHEHWKERKCQPNNWRNVSPDPKSSCGPYTPEGHYSNKLFIKQYNGGESQLDKPTLGKTSEKNHDTIGMIAIDVNGNIAAGASTNGMRNKIPGRVGDSPIPGSGAYVDRNVGGAAATGDGDVMMRFMPALLTVEGMRKGLDPCDAANQTLRHIINYYPNFSGAIVATTKDGKFGAACHGFREFSYCVANIRLNNVTVVNELCSK